MPHFLALTDTLLADRRVFTEISSWYKLGRGSANFCSSTFAVSHNGSTGQYDPELSTSPTSPRSSTVEDEGRWFHPALGFVSRIRPRAKGPTPREIYLADSSRVWPAFVLLVYVIPDARSTGVPSLQTRLCAGSPAENIRLDAHDVAPDVHPRSTRANRSP